MIHDVDFPFFQVVSIGQNKVRRVGDAIGVRPAFEIKTIHAHDDGTAFVYPFHQRFLRYVAAAASISEKFFKFLFAKDAVVSKRKSRSINTMLFTKKSPWVIPKQDNPATN